MTEARTTPRRRGSLREEQKRATRARLIEAARAHFCEHGYAAVTIDDVAADVGCSRATFYLHFPSKLAILQAVSEDDVQSATEFYDGLDKVLATGSRDVFAAWVTDAIAWFTEHKDMLAAWNEATALEPDFTATAREGITALPDAMPRYLSRQAPEQRAEARLRVELFVAQLERFFARWALQGTIEVAESVAVDVLTDIWFPALTTN
ncbi:TetR/AcrR family transcriptional regulator [Gordonia sp. TBRC 11910]|uniref:TetR/AcrR family transcriptional regulator n=1 Tax=Gordonia asplenii TaxID=2725283 RepID=A0A848KWT4_9ACTN|nr:TetR/AcrR family transcriptional regulator [Gordonia asplenii]NMO02769.1 TetR/AcrR family transcriptional regulator [Gordonia asplenii]